MIPNFQLNHPRLSLTFSWGGGNADLWTHPDPPLDSSTEV